MQIFTHEIETLYILKMNLGTDYLTWNLVYFILHTKIFGCRFPWSTYAILYFFTYEYTSAVISALNICNSLEFTFENLGTHCAAWYMEYTLWKSGKRFYDGNIDLFMLH